MTETPLSVLTAGMQLGRYRLIRQLAIGGMAEVYLARATGIEGFEKLVVLKRILPQYATRRDFVAMFLDEARLAARLHHPNVVQVFDIGSQIGNYYFAMEYVHGQDVRAILSTAGRLRRRVPLGCALSIVLGACRGLHYAHELADDAGRPLGLVHRDVSPSNIIVTYDGCTKVLDFGVAKATSQEGQTQAGTLKGKIAYMSPEQCQGERLDRRSDVFALGILLFEITTGTRLFKGDSELQILKRIADEDAPSPATRRPDYPPELERIVRKALARDRNERYATAMALERDLESFAREARLSTSPIDLAEFLSELFPGDSRKLGAPAPAPAPAPLGKRKPVREDEPSILIIDSFDSGVEGELAAGTDDGTEIQIDVAPVERPQLSLVPAPPATARRRASTLGLPRDASGRSWLWLGLLGGLAAGALVAFVLLAGRGEAPPRVRTIEVPVPVPVEAAAPAVPEPAVPAPAVPEPEVTEAATEAAAVPKPRATVEDDDPQPAVRAEEPRAEEPRAERRRPRRVRRNRTRPAKQTDAPAKKSWDPDSALLPGM